MELDLRQIGIILGDVSICQCNVPDNVRGIAINTLYISRNARANIYYAGNDISFHETKQRKKKKNSRPVLQTDRKVIVAFRKYWYYLLYLTAKYWFV